MPDARKSLYFNKFGFFKFFWKLLFTITVGTTEGLQCFLLSVTDCWEEPRLTKMKADYCLLFCFSFVIFQSVFIES